MNDAELIQIVDAQVAEAVRKSGAWVVCRPGCFECCIGPFPIAQLDAQRLRQGLDELVASDPVRAEKVRERAEAWHRHSCLCCSPTATQAGMPVPLGLLSDDCDFADSEPCPALDPDTGLCDLYSSRPITCRTFGPAVSYGSESTGVCELCYHGASDDEIAACTVEIDPDVCRISFSLSPPDETIVAFALISSNV